MPEIVFLYVTAPDRETAQDIGMGLLQENLAACVNIQSEIRSIYRWEGTIEDSLETPLIVKTTAICAAAARDFIQQRHPYETPCIAAFPVARDGSSAAFLDWVASGTIM